MVADTDILILLMDLVGHGRLGAFTKLNFLTGKLEKATTIDRSPFVTV